MITGLDRPLNSALPRQMIPWSDKIADKDDFGVSLWMKSCLDGLEGIGRYQFFNNLKLKENYEIINGRFILQHYLDSEDYFDLASAISQEFQLPNYLKHYDITTKAVNLLLGEFLKRPDIFSFIANDPDTTNEKLRLKTELVQSYMAQEIHREITQKLLQQGIDPNRQSFDSEEEMQQYQQEIQKKYQELTPAAIEKYMKYDYRSAAESWANAVLANDKERFSLREIEKIEFTDMLVADRCFEHFYLTATGYDIEPWNPLNTFFHQSPEVRYVEDGDYVGRTFYMSKAKVIDRYGWRMTKKQMEALYPKYDKNITNQGSGYSSVFQTWLYPFQNYDDFSAVDKALGASIGFNPLDRTTPASVPLMDAFDNSGVGTAYSFLQNDLIQVTEGYWRSYRRLGHLNILNEETGEIESMEVDESFEPELFGIEELDVPLREHTQPNSIVWMWVGQIWQGVKINENHLNATIQGSTGRRGLYIDVRPVDFQFKGDYTPFSPKLPVCGGIFNNRNGRSQSLVDLLKPYQIYYNAVINQAYGISQRNNGKFFLMDVNLLPSLKDWGGEEAIDKFYATINSQSIGLVDSSSANPNNKGNVGFNNFGVYDLDETEKVERLFNLGMLIEQQAFIQIGITPQRQGHILASETATNANAAREISYAITETYFENFYNWKKRKLKMHIDIAQYCAVNEKDITLPYITSDLGYSFIKVTGTELMMKDLAVNMSYSPEMQRQKQIAEELIMRNNQSEVPLSKLISLIRLKSLADIQKSLEQSENEFYQKQMQEQEAAKQIEQMKLQAIADEKEKDRQLKKYEIDMRAQVELERTTLQGIANESSFDPNVDLTDKLIAQRDLSIQEIKNAQDAELRRMELANQLIDNQKKVKLDQDKMTHDKKLKEKEQKGKEKIENQRLKQIKIQNENQISLADKKHKSDMELADKKIEQEELRLKTIQEKARIDKQMAEQKMNHDKKVGEAKVDEVKSLTSVKKNEAKKLSNVKVSEAKESSKINIKVKKEVGKIKIKNAKKPPKSNK